MAAKKNNLTFNTKFHNAMAKITADKTMFHPFLCLSFHLQAVSKTIFLTSKLLFLSFRLAGKLWGGGLNWKRKTHPSLSKQPWCALSKTRSQNYSTWAAQKTLVVLGSSQLSKCVAGSVQFYSSFKNTHTNTCTHKTTSSHSDICTHTRHRPLHTIPVHGTKLNGICNGLQGSSVAGWLR